MKLNSMVKVMATAVAIGMATGSAMASSLDPASGVLNVNVGTGFAPAEFVGKFDMVGNTLNNEIDTDVWTVNLSGDGTATATSFSFNNGITGMWLYSDSGLSNLVATGTMLNNAWTLAKHLANGQYFLKLDGIEGRVYSGQVSAVPLPGAALLFGSALVGMGALRRKMGRTEAAAA